MEKYQWKVIITIPIEKVHSAKELLKIILKNSYQQPIKQSSKHTHTRLCLNNVTLFYKEIGNPLLLGLSVRLKVAVLISIIDPNRG